MSWMLVLQIALLVLIVAVLIVQPLLDAWRDVASISSTDQPAKDRPGTVCVFERETS